MKKKKLNIWLIIICVFLIGFALVTIVSLQLKINDLKEQKDDLLDKKAELTRKLDRMKYEINLPIDDDYIIRIAREKLGYRLPGDKVYIFE